MSIKNFVFCASPQIVHKTVDKSAICDIISTEGRQGGETMSTTIKKYRLKKGLTQEMLANLLNVSKSTIGMWETGARKPDIIKLKKLAEILGCSVDSLLSEI